MKNIIKYAAVAVVALGAGFMASSCSDDTDADKDRGATPVIKYARPCNIDEADSLIVKAPLGAHLCFVGDNLGDVQQVWFNDQKVKLNPTMVTSHTIILDIPSVIPGEVTNIAKFITSTGITVEIPFEVVVPGPRLDEMSNEYARPGSTVTLSGVYFVDDPNVPMTVTFPGDIAATIKSFTQTEMTIEVPQCTEEGPITVETIYGKAQSGFHYLDTRGMMFDFDGLTGLTNRGWHDRPILSDETSISGNFMQLGDGSTPLSADGAWDDMNYSFEYWAGSWNTPTDYPAREGDRLYDIVDFTDFANMTLKFEMCIPSSNPWQAGAMQLIFGGLDIISYGAAGTDCFGNTVPGCNNTWFQDSTWPRALYRPWSSDKAYHTDGEWITVSVPISEFTLNQDGGSASQFLTRESFASFQMFVWAGGLEGAECTPVIKIDNIRVVSK